MPLLTIVIPTYNAAEDIKQALHSVFQQRFWDFEVLIVDGLSTDNTIEEITNLYGNDPRLSLHSSKDNGIYFAMNKGITLAKGDWVYFLGADDRLANEDVLQKITSYFTEENDILYGDSLWVPDNVMEKGEWGYEIFINQNINHQRIFYRKTLFEKYGFLNTDYKVASDHELNIRFFCNREISKVYVPVLVANFHAYGFSAFKTDELFWNNWNNIVYKNFKPYLSKKIIYATLGQYCRYNISQKKYIKALENILTILVKSGNIGFAKLLTTHLIKKLIRNAS